MLPISIATAEIFKELRSASNENAAQSNVYILLGNIRRIAAEILYSWAQSYYFIVGLLRLTFFF